MQRFGVLTAAFVLAACGSGPPAQSVAPDMPDFEGAYRAEIDGGTARLSLGRGSFEYIESPSGPESSRQAKQLSGTYTFESGSLVLSITEAMPASEEGQSWTATYDEASKSVTLKGVRFIQTEKYSKS